MNFLGSVMIFLGNLFLFFLLWVLCGTFIITLNDNMLIGDTVAGIMILVITIILIILFIKKMISTRKAKRKVTRQPRLNRYVDREVNHKRILTILWIFLLLLLVLLSGRGDLIYIAFVLAGIYWITKGRTSKKSTCLKTVSA